MFKIIYAQRFGRNISRGEPLQYWSKRKKKISNLFLLKIKVQLILHLKVTLLQMLPLQTMYQRQQQIKTQQQLSVQATQLSQQQQPVAQTQHLR